MRGPMAEPPLLEIDVPAEESRRDRLLRESFVLGFVVLLALVLGMGVLAYSRIGAVENGGGHVGRFGAGRTGVFANVCPLLRASGSRIWV